MTGVEEATNSFLFTLFNWGISVNYYLSKILLQTTSRSCPASLDYIVLTSHSPFLDHGLVSLSQLTTPRSDSVLSGDALNRFLLNCLLIVATDGSELSGAEPMQP